MGHIQIRNVPDNLHRTLKSRAAQAGMSLSEYLLREIRTSAERPTMEELVERIRSKTLYELDADTGEIIREERQTRDDELLDRARRVRGR
jgi:plasmid stability protein